MDFISKKLLDYCISHSSKESEILKELNKTTSKIDNVEFIAKTGNTSSQLLVELNNSNLEPPYGLISILIGVNNQFQGKSQQEFKDDFIKIVDKSLALLNGNKERLFVLSSQNHCHKQWL